MIDNKLKHIHLGLELEFDHDFPLTCCGTSGDSGEVAQQTRAMDSYANNVERELYADVRKKVVLY